MSGSDLQPGRVLGTYRLGTLLGQGASGVVFRASGEGGGDFALKVLRPERAAHTADRARFLREGRLARVQNRHLVSILEVGEADGFTFLAMPYFAGGSLAGRLQTQTRLSVEETAELAAQLGRGLDALHDHDVLHRDVKPSNVLLAEDGLAALADFGLARAGDWTRVTHEGQLLGTAQYLAPELIEGHDATPAADLYALGCLLYECVVGRPPFTGRDAAEVAFAHLTEAPPDPRSLRPELPETLTEALLAALDKDPAARPTSATALARMLHVARTARPG
jgi:serine/threonine-protein kinase